MTYMKSLIYKIVFPLNQFEQNFFTQNMMFRFDLLFILLDTIDVDNDRKIADHVVRMHR